MEEDLLHYPRFEGYSQAAATSIKSNKWINKTKRISYQLDNYTILVNLLNPGCLEVEQLASSSQG
jgi:hypothetical protein